MQRENRQEKKPEKTTNNQQSQEVQDRKTGHLEDQGRGPTKIDQKTEERKIQATPDFLNQEASQHQRVSCTFFKVQLNPSKGEDEGDFEGEDEEGFKGLDGKRRRHL